MDSRSLFHFSHHCGIGDLTFISISHTDTGWFLQYLAEWLTLTREWNQYIWKWSSRHPDQIRINLGSNPRSHFGLGRVCTLWVFSFVTVLAVSPNKKLQTALVLNIKTIVQQILILGTVLKKRHTRSRRFLFLCRRLTSESDWPSSSSSLLNSLSDIIFCRHCRQATIISHCKQFNNLLKTP